MKEQYDDTRCSRQLVGRMIGIGFRRKTLETS
jgi:hypothetical protein